MQTETARASGKNLSERTAGFLPFAMDLAGRFTRPLARKRQDRVKGLSFADQPAAVTAAGQAATRVAPGWNTATWIACALATLAAGVMVPATGMSVAPDSLLIMGGVIAVPGVLGFIYTRLRPDPFMGPPAAALAAYLWGGFAVVILSLAALGTHAPLVDVRLDHADAMLGIDTPALIAWLARHAPMPIVTFCYNTTNRVLVAMIVLLGLTRRHRAMWQLCFTLVAGALICTLISALAPALGTFVHYNIPVSVRALLPHGAGIYFLQTVEKYRAVGVSHVITVRDLVGVVTFPSFHTMMALVVPYALRDRRWLRWPAILWCAIVLVSTIPVGGHYVIDLLAGGAVWLCLAPLPDAIRSWRQRRARMQKGGA